MTDEKRYFVRWKDLEHGPWQLTQVRRLLTATLDPKTGTPNPEYEVRNADEGEWLPASDVSELYDLYKSDTIAPMTTIPATPRAKTIKN